MSDDTGVNIGIAGLGFMGATHLQAYSKLPQVRVAALCSQNDRALSGHFSAAAGNLNRPQERIDTSGMNKYGNLDQMLEDRTIDAVDICLPTDLHAAAAISSLKSGRHVLCEKPMALDISDCACMIDTAAQQNRILMIGQVLRFWDAYRRLRQFARSEEYGRPRSATFTRRCGVPDWSNWLPDETRSGGAILDLLIHDIDQILMLFGNPDRVVAKSIGEPEAIAASFIYPSNIEVRLQGGWFQAGTPFSMGFQVRAERAILELGPTGLFLSDQSGQRKEIAGAGEDPFQNELAYFADCCLRETQADLCPPRESARAVEIALRLKQSRARGGEQIKC